MTVGGGGRGNSLEIEFGFAWNFPAPIFWLIFFNPWYVTYPLVWNVFTQHGAASHGIFRWEKTKEWQEKLLWKLTFEEVSGDESDVCWRLYRKDKMWLCWWERRQNKCCFTLSFTLSSLFSPSVYRHIFIMLLTVPHISNPFLFPVYFLLSSFRLRPFNTASSFSSRFSINLEDVFLRFSWLQLSLHFHIYFGFLVDAVFLPFLSISSILPTQMSSLFLSPNLHIPSSLLYFPYQVSSFISFPHVLLKLFLCLSSTPLWLPSLHSSLLSFPIYPPQPFNFKTTSG